MRRLPLSILLILALIFGPLLPARAGWSCPSGTECVADAGHGFRCVTGECGGHSQHSCCLTRSVRRCHHGAFPGLGPRHSGPPTIEEEDHCRYQSATCTQLTAARDDHRVTNSVTGTLALLPPALTAVPPTTSATRWIVDTYGYRPPPERRSGPVRAPPTS